jgi:hypothetical protein
MDRRNTQEGGADLALHDGRCGHTLRALPTYLGAANLDGAGAACVTEYPLTS